MNTLTALPPELTESVTAHLAAVVAIASDSDETSPTIPSTDGQRRLAAVLSEFFSKRGFTCETDAAANLIAYRGGTAGPPLALMIHMDTAKGSLALDELSTVEQWDGSPIPYRDNPELKVSAELYPETAAYLGQDLLHGPGSAPFGLDDKLGLAQMMTLAERIHAGELSVHPPLYLVCRPDEEIGRMEAVESLAELLAARGVKLGYTLDGLAPFEINTENFNAAEARIRFQAKPRTVAPLQIEREVVLRVQGAKSHGATAKAEGYLNATVILARALAPLSRRNDILPLWMASDALCETDADIAFWVRGVDEAAYERALAALLEAFENQVSPAAYRGAKVSVATSRDKVDTFTDGGLVLFDLLATLLRLDGPMPLLSEHSEGREGYSNPYFVERTDDGFVLQVRLRDFDPEGLKGRKDHVAQVAEAAAGSFNLEVVDQYINMGPQMEARPELVAFAEEAARRVGVSAVRQPIRGGTGVDPFLDRGVYIANLGTGYFAPESEKEFTSKQMAARHVLWLEALMQVVAEAAQ